MHRLRLSYTNIYWVGSCVQMKSSAWTSLLHPCPRRKKLDNYGKDVVEAIRKADSSAAAKNAANDLAIEEKLAGVITSCKEAAEAAKKSESSAASAAISSQNN